VHDTQTYLQCETKFSSPASYLGIIEIVSVPAHKRVLIKGPLHEGILPLFKCSHGDTCINVLEQFNIVTFIF